jgi:hypothetical protein
MSAFEQRVDVPDKNYQYLLFAAEPYESVGFKIPAKEIDKSQEKFFTHWNPEKHIFTVTSFLSSLFRSCSFISKTSLKLLFPVFDRNVSARARPGLATVHSRL